MNVDPAGDGFNAARRNAENRVECWCWVAFVRLLSKAGESLVRMFNLRARCVLQQIVNDSSTRVCLEWPEIVRGQFECTRSVAPRRP